MRRYALLLSSLLISAIAAAQDKGEQFSMSSAADGHILQGEVDKPSGTPRAVVVMFPGSGTHSRDFPSQAPGAPRSFIFRELSDRLTRAGFATVRYDERGLRCGSRDKPDTIGRCFNDDDARLINWNTLHGDALAIYRQADQVAATPCIVALGHSEGVVHIAQLIARGEANPVGVVSISGPFRSIDQVLPYQRVQMIPRAVATADANHDGIVTVAELAAHVPQSPLSRYGSVDRIPWPEGWSFPAGGARKADVAALRRASAAAFRKLAVEVLSHRDDDPFTTPIAGGGTSVVASYGWYKPFFRPAPPVIGMFAKYRGRIAAFFGDIDGNIDARAEAAALAQGFPRQRRTIDIAHGKGHNLGPNGSAGPMLVDRQMAIVDAVVRLTKGCEA